MKSIGSLLTAAQMKQINTARRLFTLQLNLLVQRATIKLKLSCTISSSSFDTFCLFWIFRLPLLFDDLELGCLQYNSTIKTALSFNFDWVNTRFVSIPCKPNKKHTPRNDVEFQRICFITVTNQSSLFTCDKSFCFKVSHCCRLFEL